MCRPAVWVELSDGGGDRASYDGTATELYRIASSIHRLLYILNATPNASCISVHLAQNIALCNLKTSAGGTCFYCHRRRHRGHTRQTSNRARQTYFGMRGAVNYHPRNEHISSIHTCNDCFGSSLSLPNTCRQKFNCT